jgi:hypothetical protein
MSPDLLAVAFLVVFVIGLAAFAIATGKDEGLRARDGSAHAGEILIGVLGHGTYTKS